MALNMDKNKIIIGQLMIRPAMSKVAEMEVTVSQKLDMSIEEHIEMDLHIHADALAASISAARSMGMGFDIENIFGMIREKTNKLDEIDKAGSESIPQAIQELLSNMGSPYAPEQEA